MEKISRQSYVFIIFWYFIFLVHIDVVVSLRSPSITRNLLGGINSSSSSSTSSDPSSIHRLGYNQQLSRLSSSSPSTSSTSTSDNNNINNEQSFPLDGLHEHSSLGIKRRVVWNPNSQSFYTRNTDSETMTLLSSIHRFLYNCFLPSGKLSKDYYNYTLWRLLQRFISATSSVFGTQALLFALGFRKSHIGVAAATTWVLKDALGKISRIMWASENGRKFDIDAKRWRFRSSVLYAIGNGLEVLTYLTPSLFLIAAAAANGLKQMAMLTSSATRNAIYKSFSRSADNIGDITAKGEAQLAVVDLLGMIAGVYVSKAINADKLKITILYMVLSVLDLLCIYKEVQSVVFDKLNFQRTYMVMRALQHAAISPTQFLANLNMSSSSSSPNPSPKSIPSLNSSRNSQNDVSIESGFTGQFYSIYNSNPNSLISSTSVTITSASASNSVSATNSSDNINSDSAAVSPNNNHNKDNISSNPTPTSCSIAMLSPDRIAKCERILKSSPLGEEVFRTWSTLRADPSVVRASLDLFGVNEPFIVVLRAQKVPFAVASPSLNPSRIFREIDGVMYKFKPQILLHRNATHHDVLRSLIIVNRMVHLIETQPDEAWGRSMSTDSVTVGPDSLISLVRSGYQYERMYFNVIQQVLIASGWDLNKFLFGDIRQRVEW